VTHAYLIVGDIGGTNTRLAVVGSSGDGLSESRRFHNADFGSFGQLLSKYLADIQVSSAAAISLAVAGVTSGRVVQLTNHPWSIDRDELSKAANVSNVLFTNDLQALGLSLAHARSAPAVPLTDHGAGQNLAPRLVIGVGTGFNAALVTQDSESERPMVNAAECGHMTLAIETAQELRLRDFLARGRGRASVERALSGAGLVEIYQWVAGDIGPAGVELTGPEIAQQAVSNGDPACREAAAILLKLLARTAGDLALAFLPRGGIYFAGSVARALAPLIPSVGFLDEFVAKGRQTELMRSFPLFLMPDDSAALLGCVVHAHDQVKHMEQAT
jgi:glucokinase